MKKTLKLHRKSYIRNVVILVAVQLMFSAFAYAQTTAVKGIITDSQTGESLPGVNVVEKGTSTGTITNIDGEYQITVSEDATLIISFIGYESQEIPVAGKTIINVKLATSFTELDEFVAIGYGVVNKRDLTGAVSSIKSEELKQSPVANVAEALQGKLAGVAVSSQDGRPGADVNIRIRGGGSITQSNAPLVVVDGIIGFSLSDVPADQIESVDVLKDAASTAVYGARGANGVILVTTKGLNAPKGKTHVSYSGYLQTKQVAKRLDVLNPQEYLLHQWSYTTAYGGNAPDAIASYYGLGSAYGNHYSEYAGTEIHNYTDDLLRDATAQSHNISVTSNTEKTSVAFSLNSSEDQGLKIKSGYERYNAMLKLEHELYNNVKIGFDVKYIQSKTEGRESTRNGSGSILSAAYMFKPIDNPLGHGDLTLSPGIGNGDVNLDDTYNPYDATMRIEDITEQERMYGTAYLNWEIIKGLTFRTEFAGNKRLTENKFYNEGIANDDKEARMTVTRGTGMRSTTTVNYEVQGLSDHKLNFLAGNELSSGQSSSTRIYGKGYADNFDFESALGKMEFAPMYNVVEIIDPTTGEVSETINEINKDNFDFYNNIGVKSTTQSYFGRLKYSYLGRYLLTATMRADGSSKFAPNNRWAYFPASAFAWRVSDEPFLEDTRNWLDNLKLRMSYGTAGSDRIPYNAWHTLYDVNFASTGEVILDPKKIYPNADLKWETTVSRNIGLDFGVFNNRIYGTVELYSNYTKDLLVQVPLNPALGFERYFDNIGKTSNKGAEVSLGVDIIRKRDFTVSFSATYNYNKNNIDELVDGILTDYGSNWNSTSTYPRKEFLFKEGYSIGTVQGYESEGFYSTSDFNYDDVTGQYTLKDGVPYYADGFNETGNYPNPFYVVRDVTDDEGNVTQTRLRNIFPGAVKLKDVSEDGEIDGDDVTKLGEITPRHTGGFGLSVYYKGLDASTNFTYALGGKVYNVAGLLNTTGRKDNTFGANRLAFVNDAYKMYDVNADGDLVAVTDPTELDALNADAEYHAPYMENGLVLSSFLEDASYLRMNNVTIGYTIPQRLTKKVAIERLRLYFTGGNLLTFTNYSGIDPEINANESKGDFSTPGLDFGSYPRAKTFTFGVNIDF